MRLIEILQQQSVLEVGCTLGINQIILGTRFLQITGNCISRSGNGVATVQALSGTERLPGSLLDHAPGFSRDSEAYLRIQIKQGIAVFLHY